MTNARVILGTAAVALASGLAVYAAQHERTAQHQMAATHTGLSMFAALHDDCGTGQAASTDKSHVPAQFAQALELTSAQLAEIERMSTELCQAMSKAHEGMMNVLTPQQRARIAELHGGGHDAGGLHALMKRLHGGGK
jgi:hypothetical protein